jgi:NADH-quinone oxidoreductase subunit M
MLVAMATAFAFSHHRLVGRRVRLHDAPGLRGHQRVAGPSRSAPLAFFLAFAIEVPMFPFRTWLPDAHTEAPTAGSVMLAAAC